MNKPALYNTMHALCMQYTSDCVTPRKHKSGAGWRPPRALSVRDRRRGGGRRRSLAAVTAARAAGPGDALARAVGAGPVALLAALCCGGGVNGYLQRSIQKGNGPRGACAEQPPKILLAPPPGAAARPSSQRAPRARFSAAASRSQRSTTRRSRGSSRATGSSSTHRSSIRAYAAQRGRRGPPERNPTPSGHPGECSGPPPRDTLRPEHVGTCLHRLHAAALRKADGPLGRVRVERCEEARHLLLPRGYRRPQRELELQLMLQGEGFAHRRCTAIPPRPTRPPARATSPEERTARRSGRKAGDGSRIKEFGTVWHTRCRARAPLRGPDTANPPYPSPPSPRTARTGRRGAARASGAAAAHPPCQTPGATRTPPPRHCWREGVGGGAGRARGGRCTLEWWGEG